MTTEKIKPWRQEIEIIQTYPRHKTFTKVTTGAAAEIVVDVAAAMEEAVKVSLIVETGDAYIEFDDNATTESMLIPQDEGYFDDSIYIGSKISVMRKDATNVRVRGIIWGR